MSTMVKVKRTRKDQPVYNGLALTPAQIAENAKRGIPSMANPQPLENFIEGTTDNNYVVPMEFRRGVGASECWNASKNAKKKYKATMAVNTKGE